MDSYTLSRVFVNYGFENPEKIKPNHYALYYFAIEQCNRMGWKEKFGLATTMAMDAIGMKSYNTYSKTFNDLVDFGFFKLIERSKNQYSSNIIALSNFDKAPNKAFDKAPNKAFDKALIKHGTKQNESTVQSIDSIIKQINNKQINNKQINRLKKSIDVFLKNDSDSLKLKFNFKSALLDYEFNEELVNDWLIVRKNKKASNTKTALNSFITEVEKSNIDKNEVLRICVERSWSGFKLKWLENIKEKNSAEKEKIVAGRMTERSVMESMKAFSNVDFTPPK